MRDTSQLADISSVTKSPQDVMRDDTVKDCLEAFLTGVACMGVFCVFSYWVCNYTVFAP